LNTKIPYPTALNPEPSQPRRNAPDLHWGYRLALYPDSKSQTLNPKSQLLYPKP